MNKDDLQMGLHLYEEELEVHSNPISVSAAASGDSRAEVTRSWTGPTLLSTFKKARTLS